MGNRPWGHADTLLTHQSYQYIAKIAMQPRRPVILIDYEGNRSPSTAITVV
jgi:hypothetical protein